MGVLASGCYVVLFCVQKTLEQAWEIRRGKRDNRRSDSGVYHGVGKTTRTIRNILAHWLAGTARADAGANGNVLDGVPMPSNQPARFSSTSRSRTAYRWCCHSSLRITRRHCSTVCSFRGWPGLSGATQFRSSSLGVKPAITSRTSSVRSRRRPST